MLGDDRQHGPANDRRIGPLVHRQQPRGRPRRQGVAHFRRRSDGHDPGHGLEQCPAAGLHLGIGAVEADLQLRATVAEALGQLLQGPLTDESTGGEDADPVAHGLDLVEQVAREQDGQATLMGQAPKQVEHLDHADRVDGGRRLIEDEQVGILDQRIGDAQPLEHAPRIRLDERIGPIAQTDLDEDLVDGRLGDIARDAIESSRIAQVLATGHVAVEADLVGHVAHPSLDLERPARRIEAHHPRSTRGRLGETQEHQDGRRLARAVLAKQAEDLAGSHLEVEVIDGDQIAVRLGQALGADDAGIGPGLLVGRRGARPGTRGRGHRRP
jgi:hypothetical protein